MGRPAINTVFNPAADKDLFNQTRPPQPGDRRPAASSCTNVINTLKFFSSLDTRGRVLATAQAAALAGVLIPDVLAYSRVEPLPAPLNGRALADDVIDVELNITTGGDPLGLFPPRRHGRRALRRRRPAHRLPVALPVPRQAALSSGDPGRAGHPAALRQPFSMGREQHDLDRPASVATRPPCRRLPPAAILVAAGTYSRRGPSPHRRLMSRRLGIPAHRRACGAAGRG